MAQAAMHDALQREACFEIFIGLRGLGTQTHLDIDVAPGQIKAAIKDLASLGRSCRRLHGSTPGAAVSLLGLGPARHG